MVRGMRTGGRGGSWGWYQTFRLSLLCASWWWQFGRKDAWTPEVTDKFGWSAKTKSMKQELFFELFVPSEVLISSDYQDEDLSLKSPVITDTVSLHLLMSLKSCSRSDKWVKFGFIFAWKAISYKNYYLFIIVSPYSKYKLYLSWYYWDDLHELNCKHLFQVDYQVGFEKLRPDKLLRFQWQTERVLGFNFCGPGFSSISP